MNIVINPDVEKESSFIHDLYEAQDDDFDFYLKVKRVPRKLQKGNIISVLFPDNKKRILAKLVLMHKETVTHDSYYHSVTSKRIKRGNYLVCRVAKIYSEGTITKKLNLDLGGYVDEI